MEKDLSDMKPGDAFFESGSLQDLNVNNDTVVITISLDDYKVNKNAGVPYLIVIDTIPWK